MARCGLLSFARGSKVARWASLGALLACLALWAPAAEAAITVNTTADPGPAGQCSLRKAILAANTQASAGDCAAADQLPATTTIVLPAGHYDIHSQLEITGSANVSVQGASAADPSQTTIDAAHSDRVLMVDSGAQVSVSAMTLTGGQTPDGAAGACCSTIGSDSNAGSPGSAGGDGGGIFNSGYLTLDHTVITANAAGRGGNGGPGGHGSNPPQGGGAGGGGSGGSGGGVFNNFGATLTLINTTVFGNQAGAGGNGGNGGNGGVFTFPDGSQAGGHGGNGGGGGSGGSGGGVKDFGTLTLTNSTIRANFAGDGGGAGVGGSGTLGTSGGNGGTRNDEGDFSGSGGNGGGIDEAGQGLTLTGTTIGGNAAGHGGAGGIGGGGSSPGGIGGSGSVGGSGGSGGGVRLDVYQPLSATNSTIAGNDAGYGGDGAAGGTGPSQGSGGSGGHGGNGGAIFTNQAVLTNTTIANNRTHAGGHGDGSGATNGGAGAGAGIEDNGTGPSGGSDVALANTLVASNVAPGGVQNCTTAAGLVIVDRGHNLSFGDASCPGINGNPALGPLSDNGGPTQTMALGAGSAAIDQIPAVGANCPGTDQRGQSRPFPAGGLCDIGAFEVESAASPKVSSVVPNAGSTAGGKTVTINGANFVSGAAVKFGSIASKSVTLVSATRLKAVAPPHAFGVVNVTVKTAPGTSATSSEDLYAYGPPTVNSFTPASGITGSLVTINGKNFVPRATVKFTTKTSALVTFVSTTQLKARVPNGAVAGKISVVTPAGTAMSATSFRPTLSITGFGPASGPPGTAVTINGIGFNSSSKVKFNGIAAASVTHVSATRLKATVPSSATTGPITVTNTKAPTGTARSQTNYKVT